MEKVTELRNPLSTDIDEQPTLKILELINKEDQNVPFVISNPLILKKIMNMVDTIATKIKLGGRLFYIGAGTSGRLGVLDAVECVPTYGTDPELIQGVIAGGPRALTEAVEGTEDSNISGEKDLIEKRLSQNDFVIGLAASGTTPYVIGALRYANKIGAGTGSFTCNNGSLVSDYAKIPIEAVVGPEIVTGSTRMKAGTAEKLFLNMLSTSLMIKLGKVYGNLMVDVKPTNEKLVDRAKRIISTATGVDYSTAERYYEIAEHQPKIAIVMINGDVSFDTAFTALEKSDGIIAKALAKIRNA
ncbi:N-acetylmuramic acid 6-phosphate etherase [Latilactobacillus curvatus]|uniref:N-acetylmuramic acid 6-phosphate etherase n=1 Tax=Latilactobacillus curvatus TaxID=28038 RepID=A0A385AG79_LATCU|nr:N-acetylmuramic acid 6-phosphate etherase [Latilactobacillus curvatus]AXN36647.1 N-acetylmuramic acid 6-phosphate etherase [Latilactobacillus curvatus]